MIAEDQDRHVARLRAELDAFEVRVRTDEIDRALLRCHSTRKAQRQQRIQMFAAVAVVLAVVSWAFALVAGTPEDQKPVQFASPVVEWTPRGDLLGDADLLRRAKQVWLTEGAPSDEINEIDEIKVVFAGRGRMTRANLAVVALSAKTADNRVLVAFVTSLVSRGDPNLDRLLLRSVTEARAGQPAVGFVIAAKERDDVPVNAGGALAFALVAPEASDLELRSDLYAAQMGDDNTGESGGVSSDGGTWGVLPKGFGGWNTNMVVTIGAAPIAVPMAGGRLDVAVRPVGLLIEGGNYTVQPGAGVVVDQNDLVLTATGLVGRVSGANGRVDTSLTGLKVTTLLSKIPGELRSGPTGDLLFEQTGPSEAGRADLSEGNQVIMTHPEYPAVLINIGTLAANTDGTWRVLRAVDPASVVYATTMAVR